MPMHDTHKDGMPLQSSPQERHARGLTNFLLASRIDDIKNNRRAFEKPLADAYMAEAARRLRWEDAYAGSPKDGTR